MEENQLQTPNFHPVGEMAMTVPVVEEKRMDFNNAVDSDIGTELNPMLSIVPERSNFMAESKKNFVQYVESKLLDGAELHLSTEPIGFTMDHQAPSVEPITFPKDIKSTPRISIESKSSLLESDLRNELKLPSPSPSLPAAFMQDITLPQLPSFSIGSSLALSDSANFGTDPKPKPDSVFFAKNTSFSIEPKLSLDSVSNSNFTSENRTASESTTFATTGLSNFLKEPESSASESNVVNNTSTVNNAICTSIFDIPTSAPDLNKFDSNENMSDPVVQKFPEKSNFVLETPFKEPTNFTIEPKPQSESQAEKCKTNMEQSNFDIATGSEGNQDSPSIMSEVIANRTELEKSSATVNFVRPAEVGYRDALDIEDTSTMLAGPDAKESTSTIVSAYPLLEDDSAGSLPSQKLGKHSGINSGEGGLEDDSRSSFDSFKTPASRELTSSEVPPEEDSQSSFASQRSAKQRWDAVDERSAVFPAENLFEYQWPQTKLGEYYLLQEQVSEYLNVKSFKRKHPDLTRRVCDMDEKQFLRERGVVTETQCDLGLTALKSDEVMDLMMKEYPEKFAEYDKVLQEKEKQTISEKHKLYSTPNVDKSKMAEFVKKAIHSAAEWNVHFNRERKEERRACFDLQTLTIHYPTGKKKMKLETESTSTVGEYPVALLPGQYQDHYRKYTPAELKYYPLNTVLYGPRTTLAQDINQGISDGSQSDSEDSCSSDGSSSGSSQGTQDGSCDSSSESQGKVAVQPETTKPQVQPKLPQPRLPPTPKLPQPKLPPPSKLPQPKVPPAVVIVESQSPVKPPQKKRGRPSKQDKLLQQKLQESTCRVCKGTDKNKNGQSEAIVSCSECRKSGHPSCLELSVDMISVITTYPWQCMDCKTCTYCMDPHDEDKMMFCDKCDRGYHTFCIGIRNLPSGRWICALCGQCSVCKVKTPASDGTRTQWHHEYGKGINGERELLRTLCTECTKGSTSTDQSSDVITEVAICSIPNQPMRLRMRMRRHR